MLRSAAGGAREREDAALLEGALLLQARCAEASRAAADALWTDAAHAAALRAALDAIGAPVAPAASTFRPGNTRAVLARRAEQPAPARAASRLTGWPAEERARLEARALKVVASMARHTHAALDAPPPNATRIAYLEDKFGAGTLDAETRAELEALGYLGG